MEIIIFVALAFIVVCGLVTYGKRDNTEEEFPENFEEPTDEDFKD